MKILSVSCLYLLLSTGEAPAQTAAQQYVISTFAGGLLIPTPAIATNASLGSVAGVAADAAGNLYLVSTGAIYKVDLSGKLTRIAGTGPAGYSGDGGSALAAQFSSLDGMAIDSNGNIFVADDNRIRKIAPSGIITTVAGNGSLGYTPDGGPAVNAEFAVVGGVALDAAGNLYFSEEYGPRVRKVSPAGILSTVAGSGNTGFAGDGGPATSAQLNLPQGVAVDSNGNVYVADYLNERIRRISPAGIITTVAGNGKCCSSGDGGPAVLAQLNGPIGVAVDRFNNLYVGESNSGLVRKVTPEGIISREAGGGSGGIGDGGPATSAKLSFPAIGLALDSSSNLYIGDAKGYRVRKVSGLGIISTVAGNGTFNFSGDGGPAVAAQAGYPFSLALDGAGNLFLADSVNHLVRRISPAGIITTVAGTGVPGYSGDGGPATAAQLHLGLSGIACDSVGNLYIVDTLNNRIRKVSTSGVISTIPGVGAGASGGGGLATNVQLGSPTGVAVDSAGAIYVVDRQRVLKISPDGTISTVVGGDTPGFSGDGGPAVNAHLNSPCCLTLDSVGNLYISDSNNQRIRKVSTAGIITTVAGSGIAGFSGDNGPATQAQLNYPFGIDLDAAGNLYINDFQNSRVRIVSPAGVLTTFAGTGTYGDAGDSGPPGSAQVGNPTGLAVDRSGIVYVADASNSQIRAIQPVAISTVTNAASNSTGAIAPGEIVVITGAGLGPAQLMVATPGTAGTYGTQLAGPSVRMNGIPAPMIYTSTNQLAAIVPYGITGPLALVAVGSQNFSVPGVHVPVAPAFPGVFTSDSTGKGQAAVVNQDGSINSATNPANVGDIIEIFLTGEGQTTPAGVDGKPASVPYPQPNLPVTVSVAGQTLVPLYAGGAPGEVAGLMQINVQLPTGTPSGSAVPLFVQVGNTSSQSGVTIAIR